MEARLVAGARSECERWGCLHRESRRAAPAQRAGGIPQETLSRARGSAVDRSLDRHSTIAPDYLPVVAVAKPIENAAIDCVADSTYRSVGKRRVEAARMRRPKAGITRFHNLVAAQSVDRLCGVYTVRPIGGTYRVAGPTANCPTRRVTQADFCSVRVRRRHLFTQHHRFAGTIGDGGHLDWRGRSRRAGPLERRKRCFRPKKR